MASAVIVAAGSATRMGEGVDKLFLELAGKPVVGHTWSRFDALDVIDETIVVVREGREDEFNVLANSMELRKPFRLALGGAERQDSVWNGLEAVSSGAELVAIQDGARPCTDPGLIADTLAAAGEIGAAVAATRVTDTIKEADPDGRIAGTMDREKLRAVQTPQCFRVQILRKALAAVREQGLVITDDTAACELIGQPVALIESALPNPKITNPADLPWVEHLMRSPQTPLANRDGGP
ncbi:MAG: 2-C-methyl-D-erythritol 4-phosphate cytidylyltransferase [Verrucomicrobiales bacterium]|nr:2-C-methyl-D-erythritol 4-phosphate cytidylyltransferase [Verrucomicrobiales bacterium]|tara:strand:+ start:74942 stop:75655 length:714 start_codon:yes stop_codon:yes gene_type:complete